MMLFCSAQVEKSRLFEDKALKKNNNIRNAIKYGENR